MRRRSLRALGLDAVPFRHPLEYPGRPAPEPCLLLEAELLPLRAVPGRPLGAWPVVGGGAVGPPGDGGGVAAGTDGGSAAEPPGDGRDVAPRTDGGGTRPPAGGGTGARTEDGSGPPVTDGGASRTDRAGPPVAGRPRTDAVPGGRGAADGPEPPLDTFLTARGRLVTGRRHPVLAVGSNASPAQMCHKLAAHGLPAAVPMVPVTVRGIGVGCSAHIGRAGYVAAAPYADPAAERRLVVSWLDPDQLAAVDASELHYRRVLLPGAAFPMTLPSGDPLGGAYLYVSRHGVLLDPATGRPHPGAEDQSALLSALLRSSKRLRTLLGPDPRAWTERARAEETVRAEGARIFREEGWIHPEGDLPSGSGPTDLRHADLAP
ncbi:MULTISPECIES: hypothetical protein [Streptomyces]|uniref:hypothetical protein n=1 Tax=Streptomyces TaxID=1883 RepID=UPI001CCAB127|nr:MULTISPECIES: hypothetical protein [Streptomyces]UBI36765.1 hypothetical protein K7I03_10010 [Streptomyces mobaraensis]UKW29357.1 hypothetical protein MCU78_09985 [Streptomyces sp. TYQ1024]